MNNNENIFHDGSGFNWPLVVFGGGIAIFVGELYMMKHHL